ncbi:hypothetical protein V1477_006481 [Vespula maculifrons]|uniref:Uncharacterized protein n=1 Tax=Vespula maculifrons TaxID=7453 RepID=A0ABD2CK25_VESMC
MWKWSLNETWYDTLCIILQTKHFLNCSIKDSSFKVLIFKANLRQKCDYKIHPVDLHMQQPPRGGIWVGITCDISKCNYPIIIILIVIIHHIGQYNIHQFVWTPTHLIAKFIHGSPYAATSLWWDPEIGIANVSTQLLSSFASFEYIQKM